MTTEQPPGTPGTAQTTDPGSGTLSATRTNGLKLGIAFVAVAVIAATGGALVAGASGTDDGGEPSAQGARGDVTAEIATASLAEGEHRGFDEVHQDAGESLENVLVSTDWIAERVDEGLAENDIVLIDISEQLASSELTPYVDGHIPGAQQVDWGTDIVRANQREFITTEEFTDLAQSLGISEDTTVVLYGDNNNWFAAYGAWLFKLYGVPDVRLLDGGLFKWEQVDGRELVQDVPQPDRGTFEASPQNFDIRAFQNEVLDVVVDEQDVNLVDIRFPDEYNGEVGVNIEIFDGEGAAVWGHIPGAVNVPWGEIVAEDGTFKDAEEIRAIYEEAGVDFDNPIITYCRIGERASHTWFALSQILEAEVQVYDGSWSEWGNTVGVPVQNNTGERGGLWG
ncbi:sulfurtransferase [Bogoriella caseilytica]|uniref:Sulfurtransferase n=1 Tax=Bogoriella caseilytica TaxID=56055 RepID=A0A3N2B9J0_9MICO|nr:sulfurtransferase [Bogoriella caseilytica]ROR71943.1 thiosulfate/3-mercaptopyruvate sulfurtransferase [Bogoriella caseilytica]